MSRRSFTPFAALATLALTLGACGPNPPSGTWLFVNGEVISDTCNVAEGEVASGNFALINNDNGTFTIDPEDGTDPFLCTIEGDDFVCPERLQDDLGDDNTTLALHVEASGFFDSDTFVTGTQTATISCMGDGCGLASLLYSVDFPCTTVVRFTASYKG